MTFKWLAGVIPSRDGGKTQIIPRTTPYKFKNEVITLKTILKVYMTSVKMFATSFKSIFHSWKVFLIELLSIIYETK